MVCIRPIPYASKVTATIAAVVSAVFPPICPSGCQEQGQPFCRASQLQTRGERNIGEH